MRRNDLTAVSNLSCDGIGEWRFGRPEIGFGNHTSQRHHGSMHLCNRHRVCNFHRRNAGALRSHRADGDLGLCDRVVEARRGRRTPRRRASREGFRNSGRRFSSEHQHRVAVAVEAVLAGHGLGVGAPQQLVPGERADKEQAASSAAGGSSSPGASTTRNSNGGWMYSPVSPRNGSSPPGPAALSSVRVVVVPTATTRPPRPSRPGSHPPSAASPRTTRGGSRASSGSSTFTGANVPRPTCSVTRAVPIPLRRRVGQAAPA